MMLMLMVSQPLRITCTARERRQQRVEGGREGGIEGGRRLSQSGLCSGNRGRRQKKNVTVADVETKSYLLTC